MDAIIRAFELLVAGLLDFVSHWTDFCSRYSYILKSLNVIILSYINITYWYCAFAIYLESKSWCHIWKHQHIQLIQYLWIQMDLHHQSHQLSCCNSRTLSPEMGVVLQQNLVLLVLKCFLIVDKNVETEPCLSFLGGIPL